METHLRRSPERPGPFATFSGRAVERVYGPDDLRGFDPARKLGFPGAAPFTRGVQPTMYRGRLWTMRQYAGYATAEESNARYRYLLSHGTTGLSVAFDLPTQIGLDPDDPRSLGEVGRVGVSVASVEDARRLFDGIPLRDVTTSMTINAPASVLLSYYLVTAMEQGFAQADCGGTVQNDILKEYVARGTYIFPPAPSLRLTVDVMEYCARNVPRWNTISVSGYHIREAGATAAQELGFTLAHGREYVRAAVARGLPVDAFAPRISFFFNAHNDLFEEIAKFRAARRMWDRIMAKEFGAKDPRSRMLRFHAQTAGSMLTAQQPENNIVRVTIQALAAVLGGCQSLHTNSFDEALALPAEKAARIALRSQQVIAHESGVASTVDPCGGSFFLERLTDDLEEEATSLIADIDAQGGVLSAIERGWMQRRIHESAYLHQRAVEEGTRAVVGVNAHAATDEEPPALLRIGAAVEERAREAVAALRARRDAGSVQSALSELAAAARREDNLLPAIVACARIRATTGEICGALREVFGEYEPPGGA
ncbi:MAG TPA: methylmalonyl-CoA mutase family protein [Candidatus Thermoplasmatota archaeon]|nr:methylmalonyl-CoA mutase family protein [Candidatus Thermoplasmatota archaeon]